MVPEGWRRTRLADLARTYSGGTPSRRKPEYFGGDIPWVKSGEVNAGRVRSTEETISESGLGASSAKWVPSGSVLLAMYGATAGKVALLELDATINQAILAVLAESDRTTSGFLLHALRAATPELLKRVQGSGQPNLSATLVKSMELPLPPLPEQRKIAAILTAVDETIAKTEAVIEQLGVVKKAMMQELLTRGLPGRHTRFKKTEVGEIPEEWEVVSLGDLIDEGPDNGIYKPKTDYGSGTPIVRIDAFGNADILDNPDLQRLRLSESEVAKFQLRAGDLLINRVNSMSHLAKAAFVQTLAEPTVFESNMMRLSVDRTRVLPRFAFSVVSSPDAGDYFRSRAKKAVAQASVNQTDVRCLRVPLPVLREQELICSIEDAMRQRSHDETAYLERLRHTKAALMSVLLTGELRVTPDEDAA